MNKFFSMKLLTAGIFFGITTAIFGMEHAICTSSKEKYKLKYLLNYQPDQIKKSSSTTEQMLELIDILSQNGLIATQNTSPSIATYQSNIPTKIINCLKNTTTDKLTQEKIIVLIQLLLKKKTPQRWPSESTTTMILLFVYSTQKIIQTNNLPLMLVGYELLLRQKNVYWHNKQP